MDGREKERWGYVVIAYVDRGGGGGGRREKRGRHTHIDRLKDR